MIKAVFIDFGGVVADEGFRDGLYAIAHKNGLDPGSFFHTVESIIGETGYLTGLASESTFWDAVRKDTGITGEDRELRQEILTRFVLRPEIISAVERLRSRGVIVAMLSDQTNWLEEIDRESGLFRHFDRVFNSFRLQKSKRDATVFADVCGELGVRPGQALFIDDNAGHIERARAQGLHTLHFIGVEGFQERLEHEVS